MGGWRGGGVCGGGGGRCGGGGGRRGRQTAREENKHGLSQKEARLTEAN